jgi:hypothetical protein
MRAVPLMILGLGFGHLVECACIENTINHEESVALSPKRAFLGLDPVFLFCLCKELPEP